MKRDTLIASLLEVGMLGLAAMLGYLLHQPLIFASLGPTAYEVIETPNRPSARPYNLLIGHGIGILCGVVALLLTHAWSAPAATLTGVPAIRIASITLAGLLTVFGTLTFKATQPAALSTTLLVAMGIMQSGPVIGCICFFVVFFTLLSMPLRKYRSLALARHLLLLSPTNKVRGEKLPRRLSPCWPAQRSSAHPNSPGHAEEAI